MWEPCQRICAFLFWAACIIHTSEYDFRLAQWGITSLPSSSGIVSVGEKVMKPDDDGPQPIDTRAYRFSWRLRFRFSGSEVELIDQKRVAMIAPPSIGELPQEGKNSGTWLELRDSDDRTLFVRRLHDPFQTIAEHHSPEGKIEAATRIPTNGEFETVVPDMPQLRTAILFSSPTDPKQRHEVAKEIGRFSIGQERR
jgi:hypothetical protein